MFTLKSTSVPHFPYTHTQVNRIIVIQLRAPLGNDTAYKSVFWMELDCDCSALLNDIFNKLCTQSSAVRWQVEHVYLISLTSEIHKSASKGIFVINRVTPKPRWWSLLFPTKGTQLSLETRLFPCGAQEVQGEPRTPCLSCTESCSRAACGLTVTRQP